MPGLSNIPSRIIFSSKFSYHYAYGYNQAACAAPFDSSYDTWTKSQQIAYEEGRELAIAIRAAIPGLRLPAWKIKGTGLQPIPSAILAMPRERGFFLRLDGSGNQPAQPDLTFPSNLNRRGWPLPVRETRTARVRLSDLFASPVRAAAGHTSR